MAARYTILKTRRIIRGVRLEYGILVSSIQGQTYTGKEVRLAARFLFKKSYLFDFFFLHTLFQQYN